MGDYGLFAQIPALKLSRDPPLAHDEHAVCEPNDLRQFGGDDDDGLAFGGEALDQAVNLGFGSDVDAPRRFVEQKDLAPRRDPPGDDPFLLISSTEEPDRPVDLKGS
jgi:hypothetical protein